MADCHEYFISSQSYLSESLNIVMLMGSCQLECWDHSGDGVRDYYQHMPKILKQSEN